MQSNGRGINGKFWRSQKILKNFNHIDEAEKLQKLDDSNILIEL